MERLQIQHNLDPVVKEMVYMSSSKEQFAHEIPFYADGSLQESVSQNRMNPL